MANRRFELFEYRHILVRMRRGDSDRDIARRRLMGRAKLAALRQEAQSRGWLDPAQPMPEDAEITSVLSSVSRQLPRSSVSTVEPYREQVREWLAAGVQGTTIHAALQRNHGYTGSYDAVKRMLRRLASERVVKATTILEFAPAEAAQVDFGAGPVLMHESGTPLKTWIFVMTLCWSRHQYAEAVLDQTVETWLACHRRAFEWFGGCPSRITIDNAKCAIIRHCMHSPEVQCSYAGHAEAYGFRIDPCLPHDPAKKGIVESGVKYVKKSFVPLREFRELADANRQLREWIMQHASVHDHGTTHEQPLTRFAIERPLLTRLPDVPPVLAPLRHPRLARTAKPRSHCRAACLHRVPRHAAARRNRATRHEEAGRTACPCRLRDGQDARDVQLRSGAQAQPDLYPRSRYRPLHRREGLCLAGRRNERRQVTSGAGTGPLRGSARARRAVHLKTDLLKKLHAARATGLYERKFQQFVRVPLLIIDYFAVKPLHPPHDEDFHDLIAARYERAASIVTSNLDLSEWGDAFPDNRIQGAATLDRLRRGVYRVVIEGESFRKPKPMPTSGENAVAKSGKKPHS